MYFFTCNFFLIKADQCLNIPVSITEKNIACLQNKLLFFFLWFNWMIIIFEGKNNFKCNLAFLGTIRDSKWRTSSCSWNTEVSSLPPYQRDALKSEVYRKNCFCDVSCKNIHKYYFKLMLKFLLIRILNKCYKTL